MAGQEQRGEGFEPLPSNRFPPGSRPPPKYRHDDVLSVRVVGYAINDEGATSAIGTTYQLLA